MQKDILFEFGGNGEIPFTARLLLPGMLYGAYNKETNSWALVHEGEPVIEFFDRRYPHTPFGQFISRYNASTLAPYALPYHGESGLLLEGSVPEWSVSAKDMKRILISFSTPIQGDPSRNDQARLDAQEICKNFEYTSIAAPTSKSSVEVWRCAAPGDMEHAYDLVITKMGISVFGDMDPLVFKVGSEAGLKFLAGANVERRLYKTLDSAFKVREDFNDSSFYSALAPRIVSSLENSLKKAGLSDVPEGDVDKVMGDISGSNCHSPKQQLLKLVTALNNARHSPQAAEWARLPPNMGPLDYAKDIEKFLVDFAHVDQLDRKFCVIDQDGSPFMQDVISDLEPMDFSTPSMRILTQLHILNIGANRILEIQAQNEQDSEQGESVQAPRQRG